MTTEQITITFESEQEKRDGRDWCTIPKGLVQYIINNEASIENSINDGTVRKREESVWWYVIDAAFGEQLWMNNLDGEMVLIDKNSNIARYTSF